MDLTDVLGGLMKQYGGGEQQQQGGVDADQGFDQLAGMLPQGALGDGLAEAFRSKETPPFAQMLGGLFGQSGGSTQTSVVNMLLAAAGPMVLQKLMGGGGMASAGSNPLGALAGLLGGGGGAGGNALGALAGLLGGGGGDVGGGQQQVRQLTEEEVSQLSPEQVQELASHIEQHDPSIMDRMGQFYAEHPTLVKSLGAGAMAIILNKVANSQRSA